MPGKNHSFEELKNAVETINSRDNSDIFRLKIHDSAEKILKPLDHKNITAEELDDWYAGFKSSYDEVVSQTLPEKDFEKHLKAEIVHAMASNISRTKKLELELGYIKSNGELGKSKFTINCPQMDKNIENKYLGSGKHPAQSDQPCKQPK